MVDRATLHHWFSSQVLPFEAALTRMIQRNWRSWQDVSDIRQEVYEKVLTAASKELPRQAGPYLFTIAYNVMKSRARREQIVDFEQVAEFDRLHLQPDFLTPERHLEGREAFRRLRAGLDRLPARCRQVVELRKVQGLSTRE